MNFVKRGQGQCDLWKREQAETEKDGRRTSPSFKAEHFIAQAAKLQYEELEDRSSKSELLAGRAAKFENTGGRAPSSGEVGWWRPYTRSPQRIYMW